MDRGMTSAATRSYRIIRVAQGQTLPPGCKLQDWLGTETNLIFGAESNYTADVVLVYEESEAK